MIKSKSVDNKINRLGDSITNHAVDQVKDPYSLGMDIVENDELQYTEDLIWFYRSIRVDIHQDKIDQYAQNIHSILTQEFWDKITAANERLKRRAEIRKRVGSFLDTLPLMQAAKVSKFPKKLKDKQTPTDLAALSIPEMLAAWYSIFLAIWAVANVITGNEELAMLEWAWAFWIWYGLSNKYWKKNIDILPKDQKAYDAINWDKNTKDLWLKYFVVQDDWIFEGWGKRSNKNVQFFTEYFRFDNLNFINNWRMLKINGLDKKVSLTRAKDVAATGSIDEMINIWLLDESIRRDPYLQDNIWKIRELISLAVFNTKNPDRNISWPWQFLNIQGYLKRANTETLVDTATKPFDKFSYW